MNEELHEYEITAKYEIELKTKVIASEYEEAIAIAAGRKHDGICCSCTGGIDKRWVTNSDLEFLPTYSEVVDLTEDGACIPVYPHGEISGALTDYRDYG